MKSKDIEELLVNNSDLLSIETYLNSFNPIRVMKMEEMEIRHSAVLGWLLNPIENHGLGDWFLKAFLAESLKDDDKKVNALDIISESLNKANVHIEWNNIDIFIEIPDKKWAFIIENKINSKQHSGQLSKYREDVEERFDEYDVIGIFLTLNEEEPEEQSYSTLNYAACFELIGLLLEHHADVISSKVYTFIEHYKDTLGRITGMNEESINMKNLAIKMYREHKAAIDFIYENGKSTEFQFVSQSLKSEGEIFIKEGIKFRYFNDTPTNFSFLPESWLNELEKAEFYCWAGCEKWWAGYPLICWIAIQGQTLKLYAEVGPLSNYKLRALLIESLEGLNSKIIKFNKNAKEENAKYSKFLNDKNLKSTLKDEEDLQNAEKLEVSIEKILKAFSNSTVKVVEEALKTFINKAHEDGLIEIKK